MSERVFTVIFHGTGEHRDVGPENLELLHEMTALIEGQEERDFLICDGPGSSPPAFSPHLMPGSYDWSSRCKLPKRSAPAYAKSDGVMRDFNNHHIDAAQYPDPTQSPDYRVYRSAFNYVPNARARGLFTGEGMDDNIRRTIAVLADVDDGAAFTLNMLGWSRGGVSCIRAANWMKDLFGARCHINIFAFDPVPGGDLGAQLRDVRTLGGLVDSYVSVLVMDEGRATFQPVDHTRLISAFADGRSCELALLPMPGVHATPLYYNYYGEKAHPCAQVARYLAWKFLKLKGTRLRDDATNGSSYPPERMCTLYANMMANLGDYRGLQSRWFEWSQSLGPRVVRDVSTLRFEYLQRGNPTYFLNEHHVTCFRQAFPEMALYLGVPPAERVPTWSGPQPGPNGASKLLRNRNSFELLWKFAGQTGPANDRWMPAAGILAGPSEVPGWVQRNQGFEESVARGYQLLDKLVG